MFRGIEMILRDRDPRDAWVFAQRICGVCTTVHALASVRAVENALGITIPDNARLIRNLIAGAQFVQDHVIHFYHLHALDWVDASSAPARPIPAAIDAGAVVSRRGQNQSGLFPGPCATSCKAFVDSAATGHLRQRLLGASGLPAAAGSESDGRRALPGSARLAARGHPHSRDPGRQESASAIVPGGRHGGCRSIPTAAADQLPSGWTLVAELLQPGKTSSSRSTCPTCWPWPRFYKEWAGMAAGLGNYLAYGDFPRRARTTRQPSCFPQACVLNQQSRHAQPVDQTKDRRVHHPSWYAYPKASDAAAASLAGRDGTRNTPARSRPTTS